MTSPALALLAVLTLQDSRPASAPAPAMPPAIRLGDSIPLPLDRIGDEGRVLRLDVAISETFTILAESFDDDVALAVEDASGAVLASDDDSGTETDARVVWTPRGAGTFTVRLTEKGLRRGRATVHALRGALDSAPPEPSVAARAHWELAYDRARSRGDEARADLALDRLASIDGSGDREAARAELERVRTETAEAAALEKEAETARASGDLGAGRALLRAALERIHEIEGSERSALVANRAWSLGTLAYGLGDLDAAASAWEHPLRFRERSLPPGHPDLIGTRFNVANVARQRGDLARARTLEEGVLAVIEQTLPESHPRRLKARQGHAVTLKVLGELSRARALEEGVLDAFERSLPPDHPEVLWAMQNLAGTLHAQREFDRAASLQERVLEVRERTLPEDHPDRIAARSNLAGTMAMRGDLARARAIFESVLEAIERGLPEGHPELLKARQNLAAVAKAQGDFPRARALEESVLAAREASLPADHPHLLKTRQALAVTLKQLGDLARARVLEESVLDAFERTLTEDHPDLRGARQNLANTARLQGDLARARALDESVLAAQERLLPAGHPDLLAARENLAATLFEMGDLSRARAHFQDVLDALENRFPEDHPDVQSARLNLSVTLVSLGAAGEMAPVLARALAAAVQELRSAGALAPREAQSVAAAQEHLVGVSLSLASLADGEPGFGESVFDWLETRRAFAAAPVSAGREETSPEIEELRRAVRELRARSADLVSDLGSRSAGEPPSSGAIAEAALRRDDAERDLVLALAARGIVPTEVRLRTLAPTLGAEEAAVGFLRPTLFEAEHIGRHELVGTPSLLAHVVLPDGALRRVDLGPLAPIQEATESWRAAMDAPTGRGVGGVASGPSSEGGSPIDWGRRLRELVVDPIRAAAPGARRWRVCLDGPLHLVPLDALPTEKGVLGDEIEVRHEVSFARRLRARAAPAGKPSLLVIGGVDFGTEPAGASLAMAASPTVARSAGEPGFVHFGELAKTAEEARAIASDFETVFGEEPRLLEGARATKAAVATAAPEARWLHLATHGYFSDAEVKVLGEPDRGERRSLWRRSTLEETVKGLSPFTLCGLALAGANRGRDALGRVPGILTAEELAGLDLRNCELAVLSACETHVGLDRGASGMASLQAALHAAGARTAITSLWKVDDERTRELMTDFYRRLWVERSPVAVALWNAKKAARAKGWPIRDWSGWILTGDPGDG